jgi:Family of unknown function (DUF5681)
MNEPVNNAPRTAKRQGHRFGPGNPYGRPRGSRNARTVLVEQLMGDEAQEIARAAITAAKAGDTTAMKIVLDRVAPIRKGRPVEFTIPEAMDAAGVAEAFKDIATRMASGEITPEEATQVASVLELRRKAIETAEIEQRLKVLEEKEKP